MAEGELDLRTQNCFCHCTVSCTVKLGSKTTKVKVKKTIYKKKKNNIRTSVLCSRHSFYVSKRHPKSVLSARGNTCGKVYSDLVVLAEFINISYHSLVLWTASWVPMQYFSAFCITFAVSCTSNSRKIDNHMNQKLKNSEYWAYICTGETADSFNLIKSTCFLSCVPSQLWAFASFVVLQLSNTD